MKKILFCTFALLALPVYANSISVTSASTTPTVQVINSSTPALTVEVTVGSGDTCLVEFSATPGSGSGTGNWQAVTGLNAITANATAILSAPVQALRITRTAGTATCQMDIAGAF